MDIKQILIIANIIVSAFIVISILLQGRGAGLGGAWGGGGETFQTRRGLEKLMMRLTVIFVVAFFSISVSLFLIR
jgi:preprotein translocase subunit SecG